MGDYLPHTQEEIDQMLAFLGLGSLEELFAAVPEALRLAGGLALAPGRSEPDVLARFEALAQANLARADRLTCLAGGGAYDHEVPPVVRALASRSEFVTSYTPYQPEVAQGVLQALFEFQTMVARLAGLPIANASLYDGASALVEAVNLGVGASGRSEVWVSAGVHPHWRAALATFAAGTGHVVREVPLDAQDGSTRWPPAGRPGVVVAAYPNYLGTLEDLEPVQAMAEEHGALLVVAADPVSAGLLRTAGSQGADVVVGEGQPFGNPLGFGGPYLGLFACRAEHVRRLPGRLVGETVDREGTRAYVTTLRTREQDIRRERATSNVCTNQTLMAVTAAIQLSWLGTGGLREVALACARGTRYLREAALSLEGVTALVPQGPGVRELALCTPAPAQEVLGALAQAGYLAGPALGDLVGEGGDGSVGPEEAGRSFLVAVTEKRTRAEIDGFVAALGEVLG